MLQLAYGLVRLRIVNASKAIETNYGKLKKEKGRAGGGCAA